MSDPITEQFSAPLTINWTLSYRCNFACEHCYSRDEQAEELATEEIYRIVDTLVAQGVPFINFGGGEPLVHPDLFAITEYAAAKGLNVSMNSNGWLIGREEAQRAAQSGFRSVGVSIDSADGAVHDEFRNMPGSFDRAVAALDHLAEAGVRTTMSSVISRINYRNFRDLLQLARDHGVAQVYLHNFKCSGRGFKNRQDLDLSAEEWRAFYQEALAVRAATDDLLISFDDPVISSLPDYDDNPLVKGSTCGKLSLHLRPDGDLTPCGFIPLVVGNLLRDDFESIWYDSPVLQKMRSKTAKGKCQGCDAFESCLGGCTARSFATTGEFDEPDPHCWK
ncbi:MAG: GeoRSP system radical SAM/SPASM protein [Desulfuromonadales bacterium]|nr:GeoRSP system radical SAM/SPASM protein [Desulfuromonadales bacterium]NIR33758.1 GeoRSP system radical SAM/SPASM protein [Desulfuromonadales bacterium]NIS43771.1 GeoRSP system radical SAM/SPASM protein [Desulfuromonadales bacterium]